MTNDVVEACVAEERQSLTIGANWQEAWRLQATRAPWSIAGEMSTPRTTRPASPARGSASRAASPVPVDTSSTRPPGAILAAASTEGTRAATTGLSTAHTPGHPRSDRARHGTRPRNPLPPWPILPHRQKLRKFKGCKVLVSGALIIFRSNMTAPSSDWEPCWTSASLIGRLGSSAFRLSTTTVSMSLAGSCFSSESAPGPFHHGIRGRGGTIFWAALPSCRQQVQADIRTHLIHRPARDIIPPLGGARVSSYPV